MSRSYKKNPIVKIGTPGAKKLANRAVRRYKGHLSSGSEYKRLWPQWDICDYRFIWDKRSMRNHANDDWWWDYKYQQDAPGFSSDEELYRVCWRLWRK